MRKLFCVTVLAVACVISGCVQPPAGMVDMANRSYMRYAMGKPYAQIADARPTTLEGLAGETAYGPMIGSFALADGSRVYRHIATGATSESSADFGLVGGGNRVATLQRLAYFRVGPDGIVNDWATGSVDGLQSACRYYAAGIFQRCTDIEAERQTFTVYDSLVKTSGGQPLSAWGPRRPETFSNTANQGYPGANPDADAYFTN